MKEAAQNWVGNADTAKKSVGQTIHTLVSSTQDSLDAAITSVAAWFDQAMRDIAVAYSQRTRMWVLGTAIVVTLGFGVDSIKIIGTLYQDSAKREVLVTAASGLSAVICGFAATIIVAVETSK